MLSIGYDLSLPRLGAGYIGGGSPAAGLSYVGGKTVNQAASLGNYPTVISLSSGLTGGLASGVAAGDLVVVAVSGATNTNRIPSISTAGYTTVGPFWVNTTNDTVLLVGTKIMPGTPDANVTVTFSSFIDSNAVSIGIYVLRGSDASTPLDVTATSASGTGAATPNPPSITPVTAGALVVAIGASSTATAHTLSSSLADTLSGNFNSSANDVALHIGSVAWGGAGPVDPAAFTSSSGGAGDSWAAVALAVRPAA